MSFERGSRVKKGEGQKKKARGGGVVRDLGRLVILSGVQNT
jgi:hypothetical protein